MKEYNLFSAFPCITQQLLLLLFISYKLENYKNHPCGWQSWFVIYMFTYYHRSPNCSTIELHPSVDGFLLVIGLLDDTLLNMFLEGIFLWFSLIPSQTLPPNISTFSGHDTVRLLFRHFRGTSWILTAASINFIWISTAFNVSRWVASCSH